MDHDWVKTNWRLVLRWYFSPYLTTLVTAPMFLILGAILLFDGVRSLVLVFLLFLKFPLLGPLSFPVVGLAAVVAYVAIVGLPALWQQPWSWGLRTLAVGGAFIGALMAILVIDVLVETFVVPLAFGR